MAQAPSLEWLMPSIFQGKPRFLAHINPVHSSSVVKKVPFGRENDFGT